MPVGLRHRLGAAAPRRPRLAAQRRVAVRRGPRHRSGSDVRGGRRGQHACGARASQPRSLRREGRSGAPGDRRGAGLGRTAAAVREGGAGAGGVMSATLLYRIAAVVLVIFAAGHTFGFLRFRPPSAEGLAVHDAMRNVHFQVGARGCTYEGFYKGFGLFITAEMLFAAFVAWYLGSNPASGALGWALAALQLASLVLSCIFFAPVT